MNFTVVTKSGGLYLLGLAGKFSVVGGVDEVVAGRGSKRTNAYPAVFTPLLPLLVYRRRLLRPTNVSELEGVTGIFSAMLFKVVQG